MDRLKLPGIFVAGLLAWQVVALVNSPAWAEEFSGNDLRDIRLGTAANELADSGYVDFYCAADPKRTALWLAGRTGVIVLPTRVGRGRSDLVTIRRPAGTVHGGGSSGDPNLAD